MSFRQSFHEEATRNLTSKSHSQARLRRQERDSSSKACFLVRDDRGKDPQVPTLLGIWGKAPQVARFLLKTKIVKSKACANS